MIATADQSWGLVLQMLRAIRADIASIHETLRQQGHRLSSMEITLSGMRLERVERRLDLRDS